MELDVMQTYLVGGAVRDRLLGLPVRERDWVVVGAVPEQLEKQGFRRVGKDFPVFLHPDTGEEYALARRETKTGHGHKGFEFHASADVSLEEDLQRRDLTVNAMAEDIEGRLIDPYHGRADLEARVLRHVSDAFNEDPLRVLRVARFAARFANLGFTIAPETLEAMGQITAAGELEHLTGERVWKEFATALSETSPATFIRTLRDCGALAVVLPEVDALFGVPQPERYHPEVDTGVHILMCLEQVIRLSKDPVVRYATLVHDVGKGVTPRDNWPHHYQHETLGLPLLETIRERLRVPNEHHQVARLVCAHHTLMHRIQELRSSTILGLLESLDAFRRPERVRQFILACEADARGRTGLEERLYPQREILEQALQAATAVDVGALLAEQGETPDRPEAIKTMIRQQRTRAIKQELQRTN